MITEVSCSSCRVVYMGYEGNFHKNVWNPSGYHYRCRTCVNLEQKASNAIRKERLASEIQIYEFMRNRGKSIQQKTADNIIKGISSWRRKYTWSDKGYGWMKSKERISINQYKKVMA